MKSDTTPDWTLNEEEAVKIGGHGKKIGGKKDKGGDGKPSSANHGNIPPTVDRKTGGYTISKALQTTVLSLVVLRRLRFPMNGNVVSDPKVDATAQTVLATLGLAAAVLARTSGADLRSRCQLFPTGPFVWELLDKPKRHWQRLRRKVCRGKKRLSLNHPPR
jgi:CRISPR-associated protein Csb1